jgi:hypothetical protein
LTSIAIALLVLAGVVYWSAQRIVAELKAARDEAARARAAAMMQMFGPAMSEAARDPRALLIWYPTARIARTIDPEVFAALDRAARSTFPFSQEQVQAAHAQWTADWLAWERTHDSEYKLKAAALEQELGLDVGTAGASPILRARLDAIEREKLDTYQRRYQEYVQVAKALQGLT